MKVEITFYTKDQDYFCQPLVATAPNIISALRHAANKLSDMQGNAHVTEVWIEDITDEDLEETLP